MNHPTETAVIKLNDKFLFDVDSDKVSGLIFIDFKKAFDLVSHKVPLDKIGIYSRTVRTVKWFESYLSQSVEVNSTISSLMSVKQRVL